MKKILSVISLVAALKVGASTIAYTNSFSGIAPYTNTVTIPQFNPSLGTLRSVNLQVQISSTMKVQLENLSAGPAALSSTMTNNITVTPSGAAAISVPQASPFTATLSAYDKVLDYTGTSGYSRIRGTIDTYQWPAVNLPTFAGYSVIPVVVQTTGNLNYTFSGGTYSLLTSDAVEVRVFVAYTFDLAPVIP